MKELPEEVWTIVAQHAKRVPPPACTTANWNDHFNQQDLVNLMRVSRTTYQAVVPVLYNEPIVQNMGLFLLGIEEPVSHLAVDAEQKDVLADHQGRLKHSVPFHKQKLLDQVRRLYLIHSSSRTPVPLDECFMSAKLESPRTRGILEKCRADRLGTADLDGWLLAKRIFGQASLQDRPLTFKRLQSLSVGAWDDGRWGQYSRHRPLGVFEDDSSSGDSGSESDEQSQRSSPYWRDRVCPSMDISCILWDVFTNVQAVDSCLYLRSEISSLDDITGLRIIHGAELDESYHTGRIRFYTMALGFHFTELSVAFGLELLNLDVSYDRHSKIVLLPKLAETDQHDEEPNHDLPSPSIIMSSEDSLELCIRPESGRAGDVRNARAFQDALDEYREEAARTLGQTFRDNFRMFLGNEVPPCPCCGGQSDGSTVD